MVRGQVIPRKPLKLKANTGIHNRFDVKVTDAQTGKVKQEAVGYNIILNAMWSVLLGLDTGTSWFSYIYFGSGTGTLDASRTSLFTHLGAKEAANLSVNSDDFSLGVVSFTKQITLNAGEYSGATLREVGTGNSTSLHTHALLEDMNGNPVSIIIGDLDVVTIYATIFVRFEDYSAANPDAKIIFTPYAYSSKNGLLRGIAGVATTENYGRWSGVCKYLFALGPTLSQIGYVYTSRAFNVASKSVTFKRTLAGGNRIQTGDLNPSGGGGWRRLGFTNGYSSNYNIQVDFPNSAKPYCTLTDEAVGTGDGETLDFPLDFGFVRNDGSLVIKVDGAEVSNYTVDYGVWPAAIHFTEAPDNGAAITATYRTESICKDSNHVVDLELELTLNEYTGS